MGMLHGQSTLKTTWPAPRPTWHGTHGQQGRTAKAQRIPIRQPRQLAALSNGGGQTIRGQHQRSVNAANWRARLAASMLRPLDCDGRPVAAQSGYHIHNRPAAVLMERGHVRQGAYIGFRVGLLKVAEALWPDHSNASGGAWAACTVVGVQQLKGAGAATAQVSRMQVPPWRRCIPFQCCISALTPDQFRVCQPAVLGFDQDVHQSEHGPQLPYITWHAGSQAAGQYGACLFRGNSDGDGRRPPANKGWVEAEAQIT